MVETARKYKADALIAGPAFNAGRYGAACATVCAAVQKALGIPVVTALYRENPGVDLFRKEIPIVEAADSARGMAKAVPAMARGAAQAAQGRDAGFSGRGRPA